MSSLGLYVHLPFCSRRCPYCGFAVVTGKDHLQERYADAVAAEIQMRHRGDGPFGTVFFGGGTPSRTPPALMERILAAARASFGIADGAEITVEANPTAADIRTFEGLRQAGCNRLSLGVQSFADASLQALGRAHSAADGERAYGAARNAGFERVSVDLIFSVPGAPTGEWEHTLRRTVELGPDHVSTYALTIEQNTPFHLRRQRGDLEPVDEEEDAEAFLAAQQTLGQAGYGQYEVSNFARPGSRCRHNWSCWMGEDYVGVGLSAHTFVAGRRAWNTAELATYLKAMEGERSPEEDWEALEPGARARELAWLRLRTSAGVELTPDEPGRVLSDRRVTELVVAGLVVVEGNRLRLTRPGLAVADAAAAVICDALGLGGPAALPEGQMVAVA